MRLRDYDEIKAISNSMLAHFKRSPMHYLQELRDREKKVPTPALVFGIAFHTYVLENHKFEKDVAIFKDADKPVKDKDYRTHANRDWKNEWIAANSDKAIISEDELELIKWMNESLQNHELAGELINMHGNQYEQMMKWNWKKTQCKGLKDISNPNFLADIKTTMDADPDGKFRRSDFFTYEYYRQAGMYLDGDANGKLQYSGKWKDFFFICVEKTPPFAIAIYRPTKEVLQRGLGEYRTLVEQFQSCIDNNIWQGYEFKSVAGYIFDIELPYYMRE